MIPNFHTNSFIEVNSWVDEQLFSLIRNPASVIDDMIIFGQWAPEQAQSFVNNKLKQASNSDNAVVAEPAALTTLPWPSLDNWPSMVQTPDRIINVELVCTSPKLVLFDNVLSGEECDALIQSAEAKLTRSTTVDNETGGSNVHPSRTSDGMSFNRGQNELVERIERRLACLVNWPYEFGEGLQILRYRNGAEYLPHYDYFDPIYPGTAKITKDAGNRVGTIVIYLATPEEGGYTVFPDVGLSIASRKGSAVFFAYEPNTASKSLHGGQPVTKGTKYVATKWLRERKF